MVVKSGSAKERRLNDKSITNGLEFCKYHIDIGKSREDVTALIAGMYDFVIKLREWETEADSKIPDPSQPLRSASHPAGW